MPPFLLLLCIWPHFYILCVKGYEEDITCDADEFWAEEIDADRLFHDYLARSAPVLIRGLISDWTLMDEYKREKLVKNFKDLKIQVPNRSIEIWMLPLNTK